MTADQLSGDSGDSINRRRRQWAAKTMGSEDNGRPECFELAEELRELRWPPYRQGSEPLSGAEPTWQGCAEVIQTDPAGA